MVRFQGDQRFLILSFGILPHIFKILKIDVGPYTQASDTIGFWMTVMLERRRRR
jgi:hypothetical protein